MSQMNPKDRLDLQIIRASTALSSTVSGYSQSQSTVQRSLAQLIKSTDENTLISFIDLRCSRVEDPAEYIRALFRGRI
jgi:hypothetical protein